MSPPDNSTKPVVRNARLRHGASSPARCIPSGETSPCGLSPLTTSVRPSSDARRLKPRLRPKPGRDAQCTRRAPGPWQLLAAPGACRWRPQALAGAVPVGEYARVRAWTTRRKVLRFRRRRRNRVRLDGAIRRQFPRFRCALPDFCQQKLRARLRRPRHCFAADARAGRRSPPAELHAPPHGRCADREVAGQPADNSASSTIGGMMRHQHTVAIATAGRLR